MDVADKYLTIVVSDPGRWTLWAHVDPTDSQGEFLLYAIGVSIEPGVGVWSSQNSSCFPAIGRLLRRSLHSSN